MEIPSFDGYGRTVMVRFRCWRCKKVDLRPLEDCLPTECPVRHLSDLIPPNGWRDGGFYYPTFCPDCAEKYDKFMRGEEDGE